MPQREMELCLFLDAHPSTDLETSQATNSVVGTWSCPVWGGQIYRSPRGWQVSRPNGILGAERTPRVSGDGMFSYPCNSTAIGVMFDVAVISRRLLSRNVVVITCQSLSFSVKSGSAFSHYRGPCYMWVYRKSWGVYMYIYIIYIYIHIQTPQNGSSNGKND